MLSIRTALVGVLAVFLALGCTKQEDEGKELADEAKKAKTSVEGTPAPSPGIRPAPPESPPGVDGDTPVAAKSFTDDQIGEGIGALLDAMTTARDANLKNVVGKDGKEVVDKDGKNVQEPDCPALAAAWSNLRADHADVLAAARELDKDDKRTKAVEAKFGKDLEKKVKGLAGALKTCEDDKDFQVALKALNPNFKVKKAKKDATAGK